MYTPDEFNLNYTYCKSQFSILIPVNYLINNEEPNYKMTWQSSTNWMIKKNCRLTGEYSAQMSMLSTNLHTSSTVQVATSGSGAWLHSLLPSLQQLPQSLFEGLFLPEDAGLFLPKEAGLVASDLALPTLNLCDFCGVGVQLPLVPSLFVEPARLGLQSSVGDTSPGSPYDTDPEEEPDSFWEPVSCLGLILDFLASDEYIPAPAAELKSNGDDRGWASLDIAPGGLLVAPFMKLLANSTSFAMLAALAIANRACNEKSWLDSKASLYSC